MNLSFLAPPGQSERGRRLRRRFPVQMYVGRNGMGKSLAMVYDTIPDLAMGKPVLSTVRLLDFANPRPCDDPNCAERGHDQGHAARHPNYIPFTDWMQLLEFREGVVLMDEITGVADSSESASLPSAVGNMLGQMRREKVHVRLTGLNFIRAHKRIREACLAVTRCEAYLPVDARESNGEEAMWRPRRLAVWRTYDARSLPIDDHTQAAYDKADLLFKSRHWIPDSPATTAYDTLAPVSVVGTLDDSGKCAYCEGQRRRHECICEDYRTRKEASKGVRPQARSAEDGPRDAPRALIPLSIAREA